MFFHEEVEEVILTNFSELYSSLHHLYIVMTIFKYQLRYYLKICLSYIQHSGYRFIPFHAELLYSIVLYNKSHRSNTFLHNHALYLPNSDLYRYCHSPTWKSHIHIFYHSYINLHTYHKFQDLFSIFLVHLLNHFWSYL